MQETNIEQLKKEILELKEKQDAVILAHYYVDGEVQAIADYVGEKRNCIRNWKELSEMRQLEQNTIGNLYLFDDKLRYG